MRAQSRHVWIYGMAFFLVSIFGPFTTETGNAVWGQVAPPPDTLPPSGTAPAPSSPAELQETFERFNRQLERIHTSLERNNDLLKKIDRNLTDKQAAGAGAATPPAAGDEQAVQPIVTRADKVHVILIADTLDPDLAIEFGDGYSAMKRLLDQQGSCRDENGNPVIPNVIDIRGDKCNASHIRSHISSSGSGLNVGNNDTVFCYIACHGYFTPRDGQIFVFSPDGQTDSLSRSRLFGLLKSLQARQTILISDSCTAFVRDTPAASAARAAVLPSAVTKTDYLCMLLYYGRGDISISACEIPSDRNNPGQFSWYPKGQAGIFTAAFIRHAEYLPPKPGRVVNWNHLFTNVQFTTIQQMNRLKNLNIRIPEGYEHIRREDVRQIPTWVIQN